MFIFYGGILSPEEIALIQVDQEEIIDFAFFPSAQVEKKTTTMLGNRILKCVEALNIGQTFYLEDQKRSKF